MLTAKDAGKAAEQYAVELFPKDELRGLRVEEITVSDDEHYWLITLGWVESATRTINPMLGVMNASIVQAPRVYKTFKVNADSGIVVAMLMRD